MHDEEIHGEIGVLAYDALADRIQCHACGGWYQKLTLFHLRKHGFDTWTYKERYGLNASTALLTPRLIERQRVLLWAQVDAGVLHLELPTPAGRSRPGNKQRAEYHRRYQTPEARAAAGQQRRRWTDEALFAGLREAQQAGDGLLTWQGLRRYHAAHPDRVPAHPTVVARFGSWRRVCEMLGQPYRTTRRPPAPGTAVQWTDEAILTALRSLQTALGRPLTARALYRLRPSGRKGVLGAVPSYKTVRDRFGSWGRVRALLDAPGRPDDAGASRDARSDREAVRADAPR